MSTDAARDERMAQHMAKLARIVLENGFAVQTVFGVDEEAKSPLFSYTLGLTVHALPELIMSGPYRPEQLHHVVHEAAARHMANQMVPGLVLPANDLTIRPVKVLSADPIKAPIQQAWNYVNDPNRLRAGVRLLQLCWAAGTEWIFPDEPGYPVGTPQELWTV